MTSDGPYPPGYEPADGAPYGRYPADEQDGRGPASGASRPTPGAWAPPQDPRFAPPTEQFNAQGDRFATPGDRFGETDRFAPGGDWPAQPGYPAPGFAAAGPGNPAAGSAQGGFPSEAPYGGDRPASYDFGQSEFRQPDRGPTDYDRAPTEYGATYGQPSYGQPGQDRPGPSAPGGWPDDASGTRGWQPDAPQSGYGTPGGGFGSAAVPRPPEPAYGPEQGWPGEPPRPGPTGRVAGSATVGGTPGSMGPGSIGSASLGGSFGGPPVGPPMGSPPVSGPGGSPGSPVGGPSGRAPGVYGTPTQYGSPRYGDEDPAQPSFGAGQYGGGQFGDRPGVYGGNQPGQYGGGNQPGQYGAGPATAQYGADPAVTRFGPDAPGELDPGAPQPPAKSRRGLIIGLAIAAVVVVALVAVAVVVAMSGNKTDYAIGSCVKQDGNKAVSAACSDSGAFSIVNSVDQPTKCADQTQPYVVLQRSGKSDEVLCLKPAH
jgi:hypothetical protein